MYLSLSSLYLCNGLLHLCLTEGGKCGFKIVHNALKGVTLHYLSLMIAQQTEGHFEDYFSPLDKYKVWKKRKKNVHSNKTQMLYALLQSSTSLVKLHRIFGHYCINVPKMRDTKPRGN